MKAIPPQRILIGIVLLAGFFRLWQIGAVPPSASLDEASIGYNAYSVLKTGGDEYGQVPLISQRGYDDWRRSTYLFLTAPFIAVFGLRAEAVRLPSVLLSVITVFVTYHLVLSVFSRRSDFAERVALLSSFLLAISPWHIYISRLGHESNATLSFFVFGLFFFLKRDNGTGWLPLSLVFFILSMISYYSGQVFIPLIVLALFILFGKQMWSRLLQSKVDLAMFIFLGILVIPIFMNIFSPTSLTRFSGTSTLKPEAHWELFQERTVLWNSAVENRNLVGMIRYHRFLFPVKMFMDAYASHFRPLWLFTNSGSEQFKIPNFGLLHFWELPFILLGMFALVVHTQVERKIKTLIFLWLFFSPLPASIATQAPHAMRLYNALPVWQIFSAFGFVTAYRWTKKFRFTALWIFAMGMLVAIAALFRNYFIVFPLEQSRPYQYALTTTIPYVLAAEGDFERIVFSNTDHLYQSYMFFLFHSRYDPQKYQLQGGTVSGGFAQTHAFGKYEFRPIRWSDDQYAQKTLFVGNSADFPAGVARVNTSAYRDGTPGVVVVAR